MGSTWVRYSVFKQYPERAGFDSIVTDKTVLKVSWLFLKKQIACRTTFFGFKKARRKEDKDPS
jgi:hypothetical protein